MFRKKLSKIVALTVGISILSLYQSLPANFLRASDTPEIKYGDANGDGMINSVDLALMKRYALGLTNVVANSAGSKAIDLNGDGKVDVLDCELEKMFILGEINKFPVESIPIQTPVPTVTPTATPKPTPTPTIIPEIIPVHGTFSELNDAVIQSPYKLPVSKILDGSKQLVENVDYTVSGTYDLITLKKEYLQTLSLQDHIFNLFLYSPEGYNLMVPLDLDYVKPTPAPTVTPAPTPTTSSGQVITVTDFDGLKSAVASAASNQTIEIAANEIDCTSQLVLNKQDSGITIQAASGYTPILDFTSFREAAKKASPTSTGDGYAGIRITGGKYTIKGFIIQKAYDNGMLIKPNYDSKVPVAQLVVGKPDNNTIIDCVFRYNGDAGLQISGSQSLEEAGLQIRPNNTHVIGCVSYRNFDILTTGGNADGFAAKLYLGTGTVFSHCVSAENSDDAWDSYAILNSDVTYEYCVAYHNGDPAIFNGNYDKAKGLQVDSNLTIGTCEGNGNGFKMGSASSKYGAQTDGVRNLKNCLAFDNIAKGFDENNGAGTINITNGMALGNLKGDYVLDLMKAGAFINAQAFSTKNLKAPAGGTISIVETSKQAAIRTEVDNAIAKMREELNENKIPTYMNFSFWNN